MPTLHRLALVAGATLIALVTTARADQVKYIGTHPIVEVKVEGEGYCYIEAPHVHSYRPRQPVLYRVYGDQYFFAGDPKGHGFDGEAHGYYGHHPVQVDALVGFYAEAPAVEYCYINGPHYHTYEPPSGANFTVEGDLHWYVGEFPPAYRKRRARYQRVNRIYARVEYARPAVTVRPPAAYVGPVMEVHVHGPAAEVEAGVEVEVPVPTIELEGGAAFEFGFGAEAGASAGHDHHKKPPKRRTKRKRAHDRWRKKRRGERRRRRSGNRVDFR